MAQVFLNSTALFTTLQVPTAASLPGLIEYVPGVPTPTPTPTPGIVLALGGPLAYSVDALVGVTVATIANVPAGVTPVLLAPTDGRMAIGGDASSGWKVVKGSATSTAGAISITVGATGATSVTQNVTVSAASGTVSTVAGSRRSVVNGFNVGAYPGGGVETARVWDGSNVNCRNPRAYFHMGRTNPVGAGFIEAPLVQNSTKLRYSILTNITDRTLKDQSAATELFATWAEYAARADFSGWGGTISADGRELTMPPTRSVEALSWANGVVTVTAVGSAAGIAVGDVIVFGGANPGALNRQWVVTSSDGAAGKNFTFDFATNPGTIVTLPTMSRSWFVYSDKFVGFNAKQTNGYFHKSLHSAVQFLGRPANLPEMRPDLGDLAGGDFNSNNWSTVTGSKNCLIPYLIGEGDAGVKLTVVDGDSITSQNGGTWPSNIDTGDADGVLGSTKRALSANGASWIDMSVPGSNADIYVNTFDPVATAANVRSHRIATFLPMADVVVSRMLHNDRRSWSVPFDVALRARYEAHNTFLRSKMKPGAKLGRVTLLASLGMPNFATASQTGTTASGSLATVASLAVGDQFEVTASLNISEISQTGNVIRFTGSSTAGMAVGDLLKYSPGNNIAPNYQFTRDANDYLVVTEVLNGTQFRVASPASQSRTNSSLNETVYFAISSMVRVTGISQNGNTIKLTTPSTFGMAVGDRLRYSPSGTFAEYNFTRDSNGLVVVTGVTSATEFTVASPVSAFRTVNNITDAVLATRRIKTISGNTVTWDHPAGLEGAANLSATNIAFNNRWRTVENQTPGNDDSDFSDMSNPNKGGVKRLNDLMMRRGAYAGIAYGGSNEIDWAVDAVDLMQTAMGQWRSDGTDYYRAQDATHPGSKGHAAEAVGLAQQLAAKL